MFNVLDVHSRQSKPSYIYHTIYIGYSARPPDPSLFLFMQVEPFLPAPKPKGSAVYFANSYSIPGAACVLSKQL